MEEFVVVGAGLAGASIAWRLADRGRHVTVLERTRPANEAGSSHGSARIFRYAYPQARYTELVVRAKSGWDELESRSERTLVTPTGALDHGSRRPVHLMAEILTAHGVENELLSARAAAERWPHLRFDTDVLWHPAAGVLDAERSVEAMLELATASGNVDVRTDWPVSRIERVRGRFRVHSTTGDIIDAVNIVVAAGGWLPALLRDLTLPEKFLSSFPPLEVRQEQAVHFPYRSSDGEPIPDWPTFIYKGDDIQTYGLPGGRDAEHRGQKVAEFNGGRIIPSALQQDGLVDPDARERLVRFAKRALPGLDPAPYAETTCLFTNTPTEDFVFDSIDGITVISPCSGHGGKFAPLIGELAADLATGAGSPPAEFRIRSHAAAALA